MKSVNFRKNQEQLFGIVTTPENCDRVRMWAKKYGIDDSKVQDFDEFIMNFPKKEEKGMK